MFELAWIQDCTKDELVRRLKTHCAETNQPVSEEASCSCVAHRLFGAASASVRYQTLVEAHSGVVKDLSRCTERCKELEASFKNADAAVSEFRSSMEAYRGTSKAAQDEFVVAKAAQKALEQTVSDLTRKLRDASAEAFKATTELNRVKSVLQTIA
jgi:chromosome segregation ATPase